MNVMKLLSTFAATALLMLSMPLAAQDETREPQAAAALPAWDQLTEAQRQSLIRGVREHWNSEPEKRGRMLERAQRWERMTPQQREQARKGMERYEKMTPAERDEARAVFERTRDLDKDARHRFRKQWQDMSPEQRKAWIQTHPPKPNHDHDHNHDQ